MSKPMPVIAEKYQGAALRRLIALCAVLQECYADDKGIWFLSGRKAADVIGVTHKTAAYYMRLLVRDHVLELAEARDDGSMRAQRYRYVGCNLECQAAA